MLSRKVSAESTTTTTEMDTKDKYFLGFDFSTQQIKVIAVNDGLQVVFEDHVHFDSELPEFGTTGGVHIHDNRVTVTCPTVLWIKHAELIDVNELEIQKLWLHKTVCCLRDVAFNPFNPDIDWSLALDILLDKMKTSGFDFSKVVALSGDGQQHGSVYWKTGARQILTRLHPDKPMYDQLKDCFSIPNSPVWMDASTSKQCRELENAVGGPAELSRLTGSRGFERYTGTQIMKIHQTNREGYDDTERISLVSSFAACLFRGDYAPIDLSDGSGMNLLDIRQKTWSTPCLEACGRNLADKLGVPVPSNTVVGNISPYLVGRYGFSPACRIVAFTGDNPASLAGLAPREGDVVVSLGSSDTVFLWLPEATPGLNGHIFANPLDSNAFMGLVCFKNGSLTRERIMERCAGSWETFSRMVEATPRGNNGNIGIYFDVAEIQPVVMGTYRFNQNGEKVEAFPPETEVRAVLEGQFLARLMYARYCGLQIGPDSRVIATGGASANHAILQVIADIFNTTVYTTEVPNSAALGGCYRAKHGILGPSVQFSEVVKGLPAPVCAAIHTPGTEKIYEDMLNRYRKVEEKKRINHAFFHAM